MNSEWAILQVNDKKCKNTIAMFNIFFISTSQTHTTALHRTICTICKDCIVKLPYCTKNVKTPNQYPIILINQ